MSSNEHSSNSEANKPVLRVDGAHRIAGGSRGSKSDVPQKVAAVVGEGAAQETEEQLQLQAGQLAQHLQDRRRDVDHREAQTNARIAQLENELRLSRLWLREQSQEFTERETELRQKLADHESRVSAAAAGELALHESQRDFAEQIRTREDLLARRELQVSEAQQRLALEAARLQTLRDGLEQDRQRLEAKQMELQFHDQQFQETQSEREELREQAQQRQRELDAEREALLLQSRRWLEERDQQQLALERDRKQLEQRLATLERTRSEALRLHRETLEMRLIAEQLWAQLAGRALPAELTAGVSKLRQQLTDEFRFAHQELETQRTSLRELLTRLDQKQKQLTEQRTELVDWFRRRQADLAQKTIDLAQRDQQWNAERMMVRDQEQQWKSERRRLQQQVQQLEAAQRRREDTSELAGANARTRTLIPA